MAKCKSCGADIIWVKTQGGTNTPIDAKTTTVYQVSNNDPPVIDKVERGHVSHWATCPHAELHRKRKP